MRGSWVLGSSLHRQTQSQKGAGSFSSLIDPKSYARPRRAIPSATQMFTSPHRFPASLVATAPFAGLPARFRDVAPVPALDEAVVQSFS